MIASRLKDKLKGGASHSLPASAVPSPIAIDSDQDDDAFSPPSPHSNSTNTRRIPSMRMGSMIMNMADVGSADDLPLEKGQLVPLIDEATLQTEENERHQPQAPGMPHTNSLPSHSSPDLRTVGSLPTFPVQESAPVEEQKRVEQDVEGADGARSPRKPQLPRQRSTHQFAVSTQLPVDPDSLLRQADFLHARGYMRTDQQQSVADCVSIHDVQGAQHVIMQCMRFMPREMREAVRQAGKAEARIDTSPTTQQLRRKSISVLQVDGRIAPLFTESKKSMRPAVPRTTSKRPEDEEDEDELRYLTHTSLILERIALEKGLSQQVKEHLGMALQSLQKAQSMCKLRTTHIERRMQKRLSISSDQWSNPEDREVAKWITQEYMDGRAKQKRRKQRQRESLAHPEFSAAQAQKINSGSKTVHLSRRRKARNTRTMSVDAFKNTQPTAPGSAATKVETTEKITALRKLTDRPAVVEALQLSKEWNFDVFHLNDVTGGRPLCLFTIHVLHMTGLLDNLRISKVKVIHFVSSIEDAYKKNPFHNNLHATDVTQAVFFFLRSPLMQTVLKDTDKLAAIMAAVIHDVAHPGTTNTFQIATSSPLALRYNDQSVLEHHHLATAFRLLQAPENDIFDFLGKSERLEIRQNIIDIVLATDMKHHVHHVAKFEAHVRGKKNKGTWFDAASKEDRHALLVMCVHCADLSNPCRPRAHYAQWVDRLMQEFYSQGDRERVLGLPISPMMDRHNSAVGRSQVGFIEYVISPLYTQWAHVLPETAICLKHMAANHDFWSRHNPTTSTASASASASQSQDTSQPSSQT